MVNYTGSHVDVANIAFSVHLWAAYNTFYSWVSKESL